MQPRGLGAQVARRGAMTWAPVQVRLVSLRWRCGLGTLGYAGDTSRVQRAILAVRVALYGRLHWQATGYVKLLWQAK